MHKPPKICVPDCLDEAATLTGVDEEGAGEEAADTDAVTEDEVT